LITTPLASTSNPSTKQTELAAARLAGNRLMFGPRPDDIAHIQQIGLDAFIDEQLAMRADADADEPRLANLDSQFPTLAMKPGTLVQQVQFDKSMNRQDAIGDLQSATILKALYSKRQLYEVMVDFWSNHFNIYAAKNTCYALKPADDRDVIRPNALGNFFALLHASAQSPAMLIYLDNQANRKRAPDENYARELMELHTVSVDGGYTQTDVQELARVLTGWKVVNPRGDGMGMMAGEGEPGAFYFNDKIHDDGEATVMGLRIPAGAGMNGGRQVLDMLASRPSTAAFISAKLARRFISDTPPARIVQKGAAAFTQSKGDIKTTLEAILHSDEFRQSAGQKVKRPFEFGASALRILDADVTLDKRLLRVFNLLGQPLFMWAFPNGYPDVKSAWDSTNLILNRWNFANALATNSLPGVRVDMQSRFADNRSMDALAMQLLSAPLPPAVKAALQPYAGRLPALTALMLASPAFQLRG
jgi:uncharacterized protein (DUF1800 family)